MKTINYTTKSLHLKPLATLLSTLFVIVLAILTTTSTIAQTTALNPVPRKDGGWCSRFVTSIEQMDKGDIDLLMIGDSITHGWDNKEGNEIWKKYYGHRKPINLGISGDQTQHVLWRLDHLPLQKINPKVAVIMIGTNNIGSKSSTPKETADGIKAIVEKLKNVPKIMRVYSGITSDVSEIKFAGDIKIIVLHVFPRDEKPDGALRKKVDEINSLLPDMFKNDPNVKLLDINKVFLAEDGVLPKSIMPDSLHPNKAGYQLWADALEPALVEFFGK
ncbi:MAG: GDSL-type esterase/lipase family protein [Planctomycetaceae bacterium]|jgi:beta-glucosidase|nr:GDSL-type esterase/lipase family protein [Planctomycetaceae bacterium]